MIEELEELKDVAYNLEYKNKSLERELNDAREIINDARGIINDLDRECENLNNILWFVKWLYIGTLIFVIINTF